ncbi:peptidase [Streptosporangium violaceochromogenes]|nr:peptidase [Streptosporangium violaceochromogenes]
MPKVLAAVATATALSIVLAACGSKSVPGGYGAAAGVGTPADATGKPVRITWGPCTDLKRQSPGAPKAELRCGTLKVPLDYAKPGGETLNMAVIRIPATEPAKRIGSLVFNFGGPGASGVDTLPQASKIFSTLNRRYDLVSFDPRGVERSDGVRCGTNRDLARFLAMDTAATNATERTEQRKTVQNFVDDCRRTSGRILPYVGTVNAARDMDRLREALGDRRLNYFGISYGTQLGAVYATGFPQNVGRFVLDSPVDPSVTLEQRTLAQTAGFQQAYKSFLRECVRAPGGCEVGTDVSLADKHVEHFLNEVRDTPLPVDGRRLTQGLAETGIAAALYSELTWPLLEQGLVRGFRGDGRILMALADNYNGRMPDGSYSTLMSSFPAISCVDTAERPNREQLARTQVAASKISPLFGSTGMGAICSVWPVPGNDEARKVNATGSAPIVVIGGTGDPATPYQWAPRLTSQLRTGVLVTYKGEGHGAYLTGDACVKKIADGYLLDGNVPANGVTCSSS